MPTTNVDQRIQRIAGISDADVLALGNMGCNTKDDLRYLTFVDFPAIGRHGIFKIAYHIPV